MFESVPARRASSPPAITASKKRSTSATSLRAHQRGRRRRRSRRRACCRAAAPRIARLGERRHALAADAAPRVEVAQGRHHHRAADAPRQRVLVDCAEPRARDVEDVRVEAGRVDQLGLQQLPQLRLLVPEPLDRLLEDDHRLGAAVEAEERAAELQRQPRVPQGLVGGARAPPAGAPRRARTSTRCSARPSSASVSTCVSADGGSASARRRWRTATSGAPRTSARSAATRSVSTTKASPAGGTRSRCAATRSGSAPAGVEQLGGPAMRAQALRGLDRLVDGGAHDRVRELDGRRRHAQQVGAGERRSRRASRDGGPRSRPAPPRRAARRRRRARPPRSRSAGPPPAAARAAAPPRG